MIYLLVTDAQATHRQATSSWVTSMTTRKPIKAGDRFTFKGEPVIVAYIYPVTHYQDEQVFMCLFANGSVADINRTELRDYNVGTPRESTVAFGTMAACAWDDA